MLVLTQAACRLENRYIKVDLMLDLMLVLP